MIMLWLCMCMCGAARAVAGATLPVSAGPEPPRPRWPDVYTVSYEVSLPYLYFQQPQGLTFPVQVWYDAPNSRMRTDVLHGVDSVIETEEVEYTLYPRINETRCGVFTHGPVSGSPLTLGAAGSKQRSLSRSMLGTSTQQHVLQCGQVAGEDEGDKGGQPEQQKDEAGKKHRFREFLPDLTDWEWGGSITLNGELVHLWQLQQREGTRVSDYTFYVSADGRPIKLLSVGVQYWTGGHFDEYNFEFKQYLPNVLAPAGGELAGGVANGPGNAGDGPFAPPAICKDPARSEVLRERHPVALQARAFAPWVHDLPPEEHAYHVFARMAHGSGLQDTGRHAASSAGAERAHTASHATFQRRLAAFKRSLALIQAHNANPNATFTMRINRFADWDEEEFRALMLPNRARRARQQQRQLDGDGSSGRGRARLGVLAASGLERLPREVDWRGSGVDAGVKDQGMCGSCFAFSATAAMEGAWYLATGQRRSFSEQQVLDCSWDFGPEGCGGGDYQDVFDYVAKQGGIALEQDYPYLSNEDFCRAANVSRVGQFKGWWEVKRRDERALMEAVARHGPVAVAVDASWDTFRYYSDGVYTDARCTTKASQLDHAVVLVGYGTTDDGVDYWLVKNTWSKFYGDDGHIKIMRGVHDCGISSDAALPVVRDEHVLPGLAQMKALEAVKHW